MEKETSFACKDYVIICATKANIFKIAGHALLYRNKLYTLVITVRHSFMKGSFICTHIHNIGTPVYIKSMCTATPVIKAYIINCASEIIYIYF